MSNARTLANTINSSSQIVVPSGGVNFGTSTDGTGTVTGGILDDYEEGTWTPVYTSSGTSPTLFYGIRNAKYTKIGGHVSISCAITVNSITSVGTGNLYISGLPFTNGATQGGISLNWANVGWTTQMPEFGHIPISSNNIILVYTTTTRTNTVGVASLLNGCEFIFTGEYQTW